VGADITAGINCRGLGAKCLSNFWGFGVFTAVSLWLLCLLCCCVFQFFCRKAQNLKGVWPPNCLSEMAGEMITPRDDIEMWSVRLDVSPRFCMRVSAGRYEPKRMSGSGAASAEEWITLSDVGKANPTIQTTSVVLSRVKASIDTTGTFKYRRLPKEDGTLSDEVIYHKDVSDTIENRASGIFQKKDEKIDTLLARLRTFCDTKSVEKAKVLVRRRLPPGEIHRGHYQAFIPRKCVYIGKTVREWRSSYGSGHKRYEAITEISREPFEGSIPVPITQWGEIEGISGYNDTFRNMRTGAIVAFQEFQRTEIVRGPKVDKYYLYPDLNISWFLANIDYESVRGVVDEDVRFVHPDMPLSAYRQSRDLTFKEPLVMAVFLPERVFRFQKTYDPDWELMV
jgi:hypothetical protein